MKSKEIQHRLEREIDEIVENNIDLKVSEFYRLWKANKGIISAWDNNSYDEHLSLQFDLITSLVNAFDICGGVSDGAKSELEKYQVARREN